jgi:hypothetical protein
MIDTQAVGGKLTLLLGAGAVLRAESDPGSREPIRANLIFFKPIKTRRISSQSATRPRPSPHP